MPNPPIFVPITNALISSVNPESNNAAGTLLVICDAATETITSLPYNIFFNHSENKGIRPIFPINIKKAVKVKRSE